MKYLGAIPAQTPKLTLGASAAVGSAVFFANQTKEDQVREPSLDGRQQRQEYPNPFSEAKLKPKQKPLLPETKTTIPLETRRKRELKPKTTTTMVLAMKRVKGISLLGWAKTEVAKSDTRLETRVLSGGCGCLGDGRLELPDQLWELRVLPSFPSRLGENRSSKIIWENAWKSQTSF